MDTTELSDFIRATITSVNNTLYTAVPAIVSSFNSERQTIDATIAVDTPTFIGKIDAPSVVDIPVMFPQGSDWVIAGTLKKGDSVMLLVSKLPLDDYRNSPKNKISTPTTVRMHDLADCVAITGMFTNIPTRNTSLKDKFHIAQSSNFISMEDAKVEVSAPQKINLLSNGGVEVTVGTTVLKVDTSGVTVTGNLSVSGTITSGIVNLSTHTHTQPNDSANNVQSPTSPPI